MTKSELIDAVAARGGLTKARAELVVNCVFDTIIEALLREEGVEIRGFGSLTVRPYRPYAGRNPRTGAPVDVPAKRLPFFKVGKELRELVNGGRHLAITGDEQPRRRPVRLQGGSSAAHAGGSTASAAGASKPAWGASSGASPASANKGAGPTSAPRTVPSRAGAAAASATARSAPQAAKR